MRLEHTLRSGLSEVNRWGQLEHAALGTDAIRLILARRTPSLPPGRKQSVRANLSRWGKWLVWPPRSPCCARVCCCSPDAAEARAEQAEAEAMRRQLLKRAVTRLAADWLEREPQLGRDAFGRGGVTSAAASHGRTTDITDLLRACLVALRVPDQVDAYQLRFIEVWRVPDAIGGITRMLIMRPEGGVLTSFLPQLDG